MRRKSSIEPQTPPPALHPALQNVLANLDVQLEEELTRYRRLRARKPVAPQKRRNLTGAVRGQGDTTRNTAINRAAPLPPPTFAASSGAEPPLPPPPPMAIAPPEPDSFPSAGTSVSSLAARLSSPAPLSPQVLPPDSPSADLSTAAEDSLESSEQLLRSLAEEETELRQRDQDPGVLSSLLTPLGIGSMLLLLLSSVTFGYLLMNPATLGLIGFGNSEATSETGSVPATTGATATASPHASVVPSGPNLAQQEFVDLNLDTLSNVPGEPRPTTSARVAPPSPVAVQSPIAPAPPEPRLSSPPPVVAAPTVPRVAPVVPENSPATRPTVRVAPAPTTRSSNPAAVRPAAPPPAAERQAARSSERRPSLPTAANPPSNSAPASPTAQPAARPATPPSPVGPAATTPRSASSPEFRVVVPYRGDRSLEEARRVVGDAYVRNFPEGARIQLGAFSDSERAAQLQQELRQQGIEAEVYRPSGQ